MLDIFDTEGQREVFFTGEINSEYSAMTGFYTTARNSSALNQKMTDQASFIKVVEAKIDSGINNFKDIDRIKMKTAYLEMIDENKKEILEEIQVPYLPEKEYGSESDDSSDRESAPQQQQRNVTHQATLSPRNIVPLVAKHTASAQKQNTVTPVKNNQIKTQGKL